MPKSKKRKKSSDTPATSNSTKPVTRRQALSTIGLYAAGATAVAAGGTFLAVDFTSKLAEADLTKIGNGLPTIVQIHDPSCSLCTQLQKQTRSALRDFDVPHQYLVANITTQEGAAFQGRMGQPHVTLILMDGDGALKHVINGVTPADEILALLNTHLA